MTYWNNFNFQDAGSYIMLEFMFLHDFINMILSFVLQGVLFIMASLLSNLICYIYLKENQNLEFFLILAPSMFLIMIGVPSLYLLYMTDDLVNPSVTLKVNAHQWYWSYEYSNFWSWTLNNNLEMDCYMIKEETADMAPGIYRLLDTDLNPTLPFHINTRVLITSSDVLHSWTIPSLGVKADANPGRLNQVKFFNYQPGIFYGQCSEICGANHSFMPISLEFLPSENFMSWLSLNSFLD